MKKNIFIVANEYKKHIESLTSMILNKLDNDHKVILVDDVELEKVLKGEELDDPKILVTFKIKNYHDITEERRVSFECEQIRKKQLSNTQHWKPTYKRW